MIAKLTEYLRLNYNALTLSRVFWLLFVITLFIRFPFFFRDYIDRDESTFIIMGQSWVDGHLPYTKLWDLKPPVVFLFFAAIISVFGKSFVAIRFFGCFLVVISAFFTYRITLGLASKKVALWAAICSVFLQSLFGSLQGVMSEHISMAFFMPALYIVMVYQRVWVYFFSGMLMGLSVMTKLNLAYAVVLIALFTHYQAYRNKDFIQGLRYITSFGFGVLLPILGTFLPYYFQEIPFVWWQSVVEASLEYANTSLASLLKMAPIIALFALFFLWSWKKKYLPFNDYKEQLLLVAFLGILFSFIKTGQINGHYLIQVYPILIVFMGVVMSKLLFLNTCNYRPYVIFILLLLPVEAYKEYYDITRNKAEEDTYYNGEGFKVPQYILEHGIPSNNILFLDFHIGYWIMGINPPTKASTHPSNLCREELFPFYENPRNTALSELKYVLEEKRPDLVVTRKNRLLFKKQYAEENAYMETYLANAYDTLQIINKAIIYQRLK